MREFYSLKSKDGTTKENLTASEIRKLVQEGQIRPDDAISKSSDGNQWFAAYEFKSFNMPKPQKERPNANTTNLAKKPDCKDTKICPYCAEEIKKNSKICRFCRIDFTTGKSIDSAAPHNSQTGLINKQGAWCPNCKNRYSYKNTSGMGCVFWIFVIVSMGLALIMIPFLPRIWYCRVCKNQWRA